MIKKIFNKISEKISDMTSLNNEFLGRSLLIKCTLYNSAKPIQTCFAAASCPRQINGMVTMNNRAIKIVSSVLIFSFLYW
jgi:hypothetical protein